MLVLDLMKLTLLVTFVIKDIVPHVGKSQEAFPQNPMTKGTLKKNVNFKLLAKTIHLHLLTLWKAREKRGRISHMCAKLLMSSPVVIRVCFPYCPLDENSLNKKQPRSPEGVSQKATFGFFVHWLKWHLDMSPK